jgi:hypothetical protein
MTHCKTLQIASHCMTFHMDSRIVFIVFNIIWIACRRDILWHTSGMNIINNYMFGMILRPNVMIRIWMVVIFGIKTTFIFYLMTLIHLL